MKQILFSYNLSSIFSYKKKDPLNCDLLRYQKVSADTTTLNQFEAYSSNQLHYFDLFFVFPQSICFLKHFPQFCHIQFW